VLDLLGRMQKVLEEESGKNSRAESIGARYPSKEWNALSWSYCLVRDLRLWQEVVSAFDLQNAGSSGISWWQRLRVGGIFRDWYSYHGDASRKIYLANLLLSRKLHATLYVPEVGPCGFDLLPAVWSGYERIVAFDIDSEYVDLCKRIWDGFEIRFDVRDSKEFFRSNDVRNADILLPDWGHHGSVGKEGEAKGWNLIGYSEKDAFRSHLKSLKIEDYFRFFRNLERIKGARHGVFDQK
jgi:hypothetical protein